MRASASNWSHNVGRCSRLKLNARASWDGTRVPWPSRQVRWANATQSCGASFANCASNNQRRISAPSSKLRAIGSFPSDLNSSRNRNFVHMKGERSGVVGPAFSKRNSAKLNTLALPMIHRDLEGRGGSSRARGRSFKRAPRSLPRIGSAVCTRSQCEFFKNVRGPWLSVLRCYLGYA